MSRFDQDTKQEKPHLWIEVTEHIKGWKPEDYEKAIHKIDPEKNTFELLQTSKPQKENK